MRTRLSLAQFFLALSALAACTDAPAPLSQGEQAPATDVAGFRVSGATGVPAALPAGRAPLQLPTESMWAQQKLIRSGELRIEVADVKQALALADTLAGSHGALVADLQVSGTEQRRRDARITIRVPADRFTDLLTALRKLGDVKHEAMSTEDVTRAYADLETRLAVKEQTASRLQRLLADRTGRLSDVLEVERELGRVITEIEQMKGERRYHDQRVAVSTVAVAIFEPDALVVVAGSTAPIAQAFRRSLQVLSTSVAWLVYLVTFLAPWLVLAGLGWWGARLIRRRFLRAG